MFQQEQEKPLSDADFIVTSRDMQAAGYCITPGVRDFLTSRGVDFRDFLKHGIAASRLLAMHDGLADRVVAIARDRRSK